MSTDASAAAAVLRGASASGPAAGVVEAAELKAAAAPEAPKPRVERALAVEAFGEFALRYFLSNQLREQSSQSPKPIRSHAADCITAYHAYVYTMYAASAGEKSKCAEMNRYGGVLGMRSNMAEAVAAMDREMDGR